jgi:hypothetical protein
VQIDVIEYDKKADAIGEAQNAGDKIRFVDEAGGPGAFAETAEEKADDRSPDAGNKDESHEIYLPHINAGEGLVKIGGNKKLFTTMLKRFRDGNLFADLKKSLEDEDQIKVQTNFNALKKVALNLSLLELHKTLILQEAQLKNQDTQKNILPAIEESIEETNQIINELLAEWE